MARRPRRARRNTGLNWEKARKRDQVSRAPTSRKYDPKKEALDRKAYRAEKTDSERRAEVRDRMEDHRTSEAYMKESASPRAIQAAEAAAARGQEHPLFSLLSLINTVGEDQATFALVHAYESVDPEAGHEGLSETPISSPIFAAKYRVAAMAHLHDELHHLPHFLQGLRKAEEQMDFSDADAFAKAVRHLDNFAYGSASRNKTWGKWRERKRPDVSNYFFLRGEAQRTGTRPPTQLAWYTPDDPEFAKLNPKTGGYIKSKMRTWTAQNNPQDYDFWGRASQALDKEAEAELLKREDLQRIAPQYMIKAQKKVYKEAQEKAKYAREMRDWRRRQARGNPRGAATKFYKTDGQPYIVSETVMVGGTQEDPILGDRSYQFQTMHLPHEVGDIFLLSPGGYLRRTWFYLESPTRAVQVPYALTWEMDKLRESYDESKNRSWAADWAKRDLAALADEQEMVKKVLRGQATVEDLKAHQKARMKRGLKKRR